VMIRANHFLANVADNNLFHYDVSSPHPLSLPFPPLDLRILHAWRLLLCSRTYVGMCVCMDFACFWMLLFRCVDCNLQVNLSAAFVGSFAWSEASHLFLFRGCLVGESRLLFCIKFLLRFFGIFHFNSVLAASLVLEI
jgi:hypothetical protein